MTPPKHTLRHRHQDAVMTLAKHAPDLALMACGCGAEILDRFVWAEHLAAVLFPLEDPPAQG